MGIDNKIKKYAPKVFAVNICGADDGDTQNLDWVGLKMISR